MSGRKQLDYPRTEMAGETVLRPYVPLGTMKMSERRVWHTNLAGLDYLILKVRHELNCTHSISIGIKLSIN